MKYDWQGNVRQLENVIYRAMVATRTETIEIENLPVEIQKYRLLGSDDSITEESHMDQLPPQELDAALLFAPVGELIPQALKAVAKGGTVVCGGIHMSDIPNFPYQLLWQERTLKSVANLTRGDAEAFLALAPRVPVRTHVEEFALDQANEALAALRDGTLRGAAVLVPRR